MTTIFAVSSGRPPAAIAVIRISGPAALTTMADLAGSLPPPREARVRVLRDADGSILDRALILIFPGSASATGEDLGEIHCHGGKAVTDVIERVLTARPGLRRAEPGEFTRRALQHGRIDLAEAHGLADLLAAESERQRIAAISAANGVVSRAVHDWLDRIALLAARIEASLDFADEGDVEGADVHAVVCDMAALSGDIAAVTAAPPVERLRDGVTVVLAGPPNSGKSTLINLLSDRDVAIVSPIAGTTRDRVEAPVIRNGIPFVLIDTAGLTDTDDTVERIGVERAQNAVATADILLWLADTPPPRDAIWLFSRADAVDRQDKPDGRVCVARSDPGSIQALWKIIAEAAGELIPRPDQLALDRDQRSACMHVVSALNVTHADPLLIGEELRNATQTLGTIVGINATEAMLDALFRRFCIGK